MAYNQINFISLQRILWQEEHSKDLLKVLQHFEGLVKSVLAWTTITKIHFSSRNESSPFPFSRNGYLKNLPQQKLQLLRIISCEQQNRKKIIKNWDKCAENYSADLSADLSVLMDNFFEDIMYTLLAYSFSFVLLPAVNSQFFQFHLTDSSFSCLPAELIWEQEGRKEKRQLRKKSACEKVQERNLEIIQTVTMINIFGFPLIFHSSRLLLPVVLEQAISLILDSTLPPGLLLFCFILLKFCLAPLHSYTLQLSLLITHRTSWWVYSTAVQFTWERKGAWVSHLLSPKTPCSACWLFPCLWTKPTLHSPGPVSVENYPEGFTPSLSKCSLISHNALKTKDRAELIFWGVKTNFSDFYPIN